MTVNLKGFVTTGIACCNICLKPCKIYWNKEKSRISSKCCQSSIVHKNVMLKFKKEVEELKQTVHSNGSGGNES